MNDVKFYEFLLKLNTYLNRANILADKFSNQEMALGKKFTELKSQISPKAFEMLIAPIANLLDERVKLMQELREANDGFEKALQEYYEYFKGIVQ